MIDKAPDAYRTISEVADDLDLPQHVLRFWETRFNQIRPLKRGGGRRYYRPDDVELLKGIRHLLYDEGYTIKGVQRILKDQGPRAVQAVAPQSDGPEGAPAGHVPVHEAEATETAFQPPRQETVNPASVPPAFRATAKAPQAIYPDLFEAGTPAGAEPAAQEVAAPDPMAPEPAAPPVAKPSPAPAAVSQPTVSFTRGGLLRPAMPTPPVASPVPTQAEPAPADAEPEAAAIVPKRPRIVLQVADEPVVLDESASAPAPMPEPSPGLSEKSRRALQAALFELSECRRTIDRITAGRDR